MLVDVLQQIGCVSDANQARKSSVRSSSSEFLCTKKFKSLLEVRKWVRAHGRWFGSRWGETSTPISTAKLNYSVFYGFTPKMHTLQVYQRSLSFSMQWGTYWKSVTRLSYFRPSFSHSFCHLPDFVQLCEIGANLSAPFQNLFRKLELFS